MKLGLYLFILISFIAVFYLISETKTYALRGEVLSGSPDFIVQCNKQLDQWKSKQDCYDLLKSSNLFLAALVLSPSHPQDLTKIYETFHRVNTPQETPEDKKAVNELIQATFSGLSSDQTQKTIWWMAAEKSIKSDLLHSIGVSNISLDKPWNPISFHLLETRLRTAIQERSKKDNKGDQGVLPSLSEKKPISSSSSGIAPVIDCLDAYFGGKGSQGLPSGTGTGGSDPTPERGQIGTTPEGPDGTKTGIHGEVLKVSGGPKYASPQLARNRDCYGLDPTKKGWVKEDNPEGEEKENPKEKKENSNTTTTSDYNWNVNIMFADPKTNVSTTVITEFKTTDIIPTEEGPPLVNGQQQTSLKDSNGNTTTLDKKDVKWATPKDIQSNFETAVKEMKEQLKTVIKDGKIEMKLSAEGPRQYNPEGSDADPCSGRPSEAFATCLAAASSSETSDESTECKNWKQKSRIGDVDSNTPNPCDPKSGMGIGMLPPELLIDPLPMSTSKKMKMGTPSKDEKTGLGGTPMP